YSSFNDEVVAKHIDWATGHGIDAFMINWWGNPDMKKRLRDYLNNPLADEIEYFILWDVQSSNVTRSESGTFDFSREEVADRFQEDARYIIRNLISDQNYFKLAGKPVIYLYDEDDYGGPFPSMMEGLDEIAQSVGGNKIYWIGDNARPLSSSQNQQRKVVDGITDFNPIVHWFPWILSPGKDWRLTKKEVKERYVPQTRENYFDALELGKDYIPTIIPGFSKPISDLPVVQRTEAGFRYEIAKAKELIDPEVKTTLISSFNGWLEDHQIEPGKSYGLTYLTVLKEELAGYRVATTLKGKRDHLQFRFNKWVVPEGSDPRKLTSRVARVKGYATSALNDPVFDLDIGSDPATRYIGKGWSTTAKKDTKSWRWGVGANKKSSLFIPKTEGSKYLRIETAPISDEIEADIYLNGKLVDHIVFEEGWRTYTVELSK
ncbi:glycoside hydrolase family 99-like domain-containing protein, partial [Candidatus Bipolaricaulota bacterium]|nr:glycoside hydrolase family 99-like domain-containing protein [Candidatus Bipolaricaulota bacterium]